MHARGREAVVWDETKDAFARWDGCRWISVVEVWRVKRGTTPTTEFRGATLHTPPSFVTRRVGGTGPRRRWERHDQRCKRRHDVVDGTWDDPGWKENGS